MATNSIDSKRFSVRQNPKKSSSFPSSKSIPPPPTVISTNTIITRKEVQPTPRIVVVRTSTTTTNDNGETNESEPAKSVQLPPVLTNGRTSIYLIRRPIPPTEPPKPTQFFQPSDDNEETDVQTTYQNSSIPMQEINSPSSTSSQIYSENPKHLVSSANGTQSKIKRRDSLYSNSKNRSRSAIQHISPTLSIQEGSTNKGRKRRYFSFSPTKSIAVQADLLQPEEFPTEKRISRIKSSVNHHHQPTSPTEENSHLKRNIVTPVSNRPKSFREDIDNQSTEEILKTSGSNKCLDCLSKYILLIIIICVIFILIGLAGIGVSAYFLGTDSQTNLPGKIVGIVIGSIVTLAALCILLCVLLCIYCNNDDSHVDERRSPSIRDGTDPRSSRLSMHDRRNGNLSTKNGKNIIIQMPEHLLTGQNLSARSHQRKLNKVVTTIGHVVDDAKKHHNNQLPTKVIIKVDKKKFQKK